MRVLLLLLLLKISVAFAQIEQPIRHEIEIGNRDNFFMTQNAEELGLVLFREQVKSAKGGGRVWEIVMLDLELEERWKKEIIIDKKFTFSGYDYQNGKLHLMYRKTGNRKTDFYIARINLIDGRDERFDVPNLLPIEMDDFHVIGQSAIFVGYVNSRATVFMFDYNDQKTKVLPGLYGKVSKIIDLHVDEPNNVFTILITQLDEFNDNVLILKSFDQDGNSITDYTIKTGNRQEIVTGKSSGFHDNKLVITGTYGRSPEIAEGIFFTTFDPNGLVDQKYHDFSELKNYYNYLPEKKEARKESKVKEKKIKGKEVRIRSRMVIHEVVPDGDNFVMLGEVYDVLEGMEFSQSFMNSPFALNDYNYGYQGYSRQRRSDAYYEISGFEYSHAVVVVFDERGNIVTDNTMGVEDIERPYLEQIVSMNTVGDRITLIYKYEDELFYNVINENNKIEEYESAEIKLMYESDQVSYNEDGFGGLSYWYGGYFYAYGFQKISVKNMNQKRREVFYINKIKFN